MVEVLTTKDVAALTGKNEATVRRWLRSGKLQGEQKTNEFNSPEWVIPVNSFNAFCLEKYFAQHPGSRPRTLEYRAENAPTERSEYMSHYEIKAKILTMKYGKIAEEFKEYHDDRILVYNIYHQLLSACKTMEKVYDTYVCTAFNARFREDEALMNGIVERFTSSVYLSNGRWMKQQPLNYAASHEEISAALKAISTT